MKKNYLSAGDEREDQRLRMTRFAMAGTTYGMVILAIGLVSRLGLGDLDPLEWSLIIGVALAVNAVFFILFYTGINLRFKDRSLTWEQIVISAAWGMISLYALPNARPVVLMFFLPAFSFGMLRLNRRQYLSAAAWVMGMYAGLLATEILRDRPGFRIGPEMFLYSIYAVLLFWYAIFGGIVSDIRRNLRAQRRNVEKAYDILVTEMEERKRAERDKDRLITDLREAFNKIETLKGLLPICAGCKKIRDEQGNWYAVETYIESHSNAEFSHGMCPECARKLYPGYSPEKKE